MASDYDYLRGKVITAEGWEADFTATIEGLDYFVCDDYYTPEGVRLLGGLTEGDIIPGDNPEVDALISFWNGLGQCATSGKQGTQVNEFITGSRELFDHVDPGLSFVRLSNPVVEHGRSSYRVFPRITGKQVSSRWDIYQVGRWSVDQTDRDSQPELIPITPFSHVSLKGEAFEALPPSAVDSPPMSVTPPHGVQGFAARKLFRAYTELACEE